MNVIDLGYDVDKLTAQQKVVVEYLTKTIELADQLDHRKIAPDITGQQGLNDAMGKQKKILDDLALSTQEYNKILTSVAQTQAKSSAASSDAAAQLAQEKEALKQRNAEVKNTAIVNSAAQGSIEQLRASLNLLTNQYDKMSATERNSAAGKSLQQNIYGQVEALKKLEAETGRHQRNVGNYTGAISILEKALIEVKQKIDDFTNSGNTNQEAVQKLQTEQGLLTQVLESNQKGFASLTMEVRTNERALATMFEQGLQNTEAFNALQTATAKAKRELREFSENERLLSSAAPAITAATVAAKGLAGTYAIGAGVSSLFAGENEKVEKELRKLVAIMTILQGLNEVHELLEKRLAVAKIFSAAGTGIQTAALKVYTFFTESATFATKAFRAAIISTGLGALIVLLSSFSAGMADAKESTEGGTEALKDYDRAIQDVNEDLSMQNKIIEGNAEKRKEQVKQRAGSEREISKITHQALLDQIAAKKLANEKLTKLEDELAKDKSKLIGNDDDESKEKLKELNKREQDLLKEKNKNLFEIFDDGVRITNESEKEKTRIAEEGRKSRKASSEAAVIDLEREQIALKKTSADEKESYANRIKATDDFYVLQEQIENKKKKIALSTPNLTPGEVDKINAENKKALADISANRSSEEKNLLDQQKQKAIAIEYEIFKSSMDRKKAFEEEIINDDKRTTAERLAAYDQLNKNQKKLIDTEYQQKINQALQIKGNQKEVEALEKEHQDKLTVVDLKGLSDRKRLVESDLKSKLAQGNLKIELGANAVDIAGLEKLNKQFEAGKINAKKYDEELRKIENTIKQNSFHAMASALQETIDKMKAAGIDATDLEITLQNITKDHLKNQKDQLQQRKEKTKETLNEIVGYEQDASNAIQSIIDGQHEIELNRIQVEMDANNKKKDTAVKNITDSKLSEEDKAARLAEINAQAEAKDIQLQKRKKDEQIKQAKFDKALQEFNLGIKLIIDLASLNFVAAAADAAGLIALAAKPIPQYAEGTDDHPGGPAIVGEGKHKELVTKPFGESFIADRAMLLDLPAHTTVQPLSQDEVNQVMYGAMLRRTSELLIVQDRSVRIREAKQEMQTKEQIELLKKLVAKDQSVRTKVNTTIDYGFAEYMNHQVYGRS